MADTRAVEEAYRARHQRDLDFQAGRAAEAKRRNETSAAPGLTAGRPGRDGLAELPREQFDVLSEPAKRSFLTRVREGKAKLLDPVRR